MVHPSYRIKIPVRQWRYPASEENFKWRNWPFP